MSFLGVVGSTHEKQTEVQFEWKIPNFVTLLKKEESYCHSPVFHFLDSSWYLSLAPSSKSDRSLDTHIGLDLCSNDSDPVEVDGRFSIGILDEEIWKQPFLNSSKGYSKPDFYRISRLLRHKSALLPSDVLTIKCRMQNLDPRPRETSLFKRLQNLSCDLKEILKEGKGTDFTFQIKDVKIPAHKMILEKRCDYFAKMFGQNWLSDTSREGRIDDIEESVFKCVLHFLYSGEPIGMTHENVCDIYAAAHKMNVKELTNLCVDYLKINMCLDLIYGSMEIVLTYNEEELKNFTADYIFDNANIIFQTDQWDKFKEKHCSNISCLLEKVIMEKLKLEKAKKSIKLMKSRS